MEPIRSLCYEKDMDRRWLALLGWLGVACGDDDGGGGGSGSSSESSGPTTTAGSSETSSSSSSADGTSSTSSSEGTSSGSSSDATSSSGSETDTGGAVCGDMRCGVDEWCDWALDSCGDDPSDVATCRTGPEPCPPSAGDQVCACDGVVYTNDCEAQSLGLDVHVPSDCATPDGYFVCGYKFCDPTESYCVLATSDVGGTPDSYQCTALPQACGDAPSCDCLVDEPCADFSCEPTADGGLQIICPGG